MESEKCLLFLQDKRVLVRIDENGCYPRYACIEMEKISSSTMRFRLGDRHQWPLPQIRDRKDHVCAVEKNFLSRNAIESRFHVQRPPRLLVKESYINRVPCGLPRRLQNGIAFRLVIFKGGTSRRGNLFFNNNNVHLSSLINALSAHMIHINLNMIYYTPVEHSPTKTIYIQNI